MTSFLAATIFLSSLPLIVLGEDSTGISEQPHAWISSCCPGHEVIVLKPDHSPILLRLFQTWQETLPSAPPYTMRSILSDLILYFREHVFDLARCNRLDVGRIANSFPTDQVPLDAFLQAQSGLCRHFAFAVSYFLDRQQLGMHKIHRAFLPQYQGRHAWNILDDGIHLFHIDVFWGILADYRNPAERKILYQAYGEDVIEKAYCQ